jgi:6-phosphogluconolactonase
MRVLKFETLAGAAEACAHRMEQIVGERVREAGRATVAISGGTTPRRMLEAMRGAELGRVHWFWVDERCVDAGDKDSNYRMAREALFEAARIPEENIHRVKVELGAEQAAAAYEREIREFFGLAEGAAPVFDVVHLGMGPEGHTASLFPGQVLIGERVRLTAAVRTPKPPPLRVTMLPTAILGARHIVILAGGADKAEAVARALDGADEMEVPVAMVRRAAGEVVWFLDEGAAPAAGAWVRPGS